MASRSPPEPCAAAQGSDGARKGPPGHRLARELARLLPRRPVIAGGLALTMLYAWRYFAEPALPGNNPAWPLGWWEWFDQGKYIESARALARLQFAPALHWYPLGYALLGAPFVRWSPGHPFVLVDLACLLATLAGFVAFAGRVSVSTGWAVLVFLGSVACSGQVFEQWVIPWNSSPAAALVWLLLAATAAQMQGRRNPLLVGILAAALPLVRPTESLLSGICVVASFWPAPGTRPARTGLVREACLLAAGGLVCVLPYLLLHWRIYGLRPTDYMTMSRQLGFTVYDLGWKAYMLLADPRPWFLDGMGLLRPAPFIALALGGLGVAWVHGRAAVLLSVLVVAHTIIYLCYVDMLPTGLWRYNNVHYFKWAMPAFGLLAFLLVRDLLRARCAPGFPLAPAALLLSAVPLCVRVVPTPVAPGEPAKMLFYPGPPPGFQASYFGQTALHDAAGQLDNIRDFRAIPVPGGLRVFALRRPFMSDPAWDTPPAGWRTSDPPQRYAEKWGLGLPCWVRGVHCSEVDDPLLP